MRERRAQPRIAVSLRAELSSGDAWFACRVLDISESGFLLVCNKALPVGQLLDLRCELYARKPFKCKVEIKHAEESGLGTKIVEIDRKNIDLIRLFLQEHYSDNVSKSR